MATKYVKSMKFSQSGEIYYIRDGETKERLDTLEPVVQEKQDKLIAGANITIDPVTNTISATGGSGTSDYSALSNKPSINSVELVGNKTSSDLGLATASDLTSHVENTTVHVTAEDKNAWNAKQEALVSGTNIKTINGIDILGSGDIEIGGGGSGTDNYNNLSNKPAINGTTLAGDKPLSEFGIQAEITTSNKLSANLIDGLGTMATEAAADYTKTANLAGVATSGNYNDLNNKPTLGTMAAEAAADYTKTSNLANVATSGQYSDLTGTPTLGTMASEASADYTKTANLAAVATSNQYSDLTGTPTFKTINSATITGTGDIDTVEKVTVTPNRTDGGFVAGTTYTDITFAEFAERLLNPYQAPGATITLSPTTAHKGTATNITATLKATKNSKPLTVATLQVGSGTATSVASLIPNGGTATQSATGLTATTTFTFVVGDGTESVTKTATVNFNEYKYHGIVNVAPASVTESIIKGLTTDYSTAAKGYTYTGITMTNQRVCYAYPASYGDITLIKDKNGYDVTSSYTKTTVSVDGINYTVYTMTATGSLSNGSMQFS